MTGIQHIRVIKHEEGSESFIGNRLYDHAISPFRVAFFRTFMAYRVPASLPQVLRTRKTWEVEQSAIQIMLEIEMALTVVVTFPNDPWPNTLSSSNCAGDALSHPSLVSSRTSISCSSLEPLAEVWNKSFLCPCGLSRFTRTSFAPPSSISHFVLLRSARVRVLVGVGHPGGGGVRNANLHVAKGKKTKMRGIDFFSLARSHLLFRRLLFFCGCEIVGGGGAVASRAGGGPLSGELSAAHLLPGVLERQRHLGRAGSPVQAGGRSLNRTTLSSSCRVVRRRMNAGSSLTAAGSSPSRSRDP